MYLTLAHLDAGYVRARFPMIAEMLARLGLDLARDPIPVGPAAHYMMGGVDTDEWGRTSVPGLFAAGEVACTGVHGANRLASNSLLEGLVFGARAAIAMQQPSAAAPLKADRRLAEGSGLGAQGSGHQSQIPSPESRLSSEEVRALMWRNVGLFRDRDGLEPALASLDAAYAARRAAVERDSSDPEAWKPLNLVTVARLVARAALRREESRGGHFRADFPARDDERWRFHAVDQLK